MTSRETDIKNIIQDYSNMYKAISTMAVLCIAKKDFMTIKHNHEILAGLYSRILKFVKTACSEKVVEQIENSDFTNLPEELSPLSIVDTYNKILALKYTEVETDSLEERIELNKMSIELNCNEEIPYINLANVLYENGKYPETMEMCSVLKEISDTAPMWEILGKTYRKLGMYGEAIESYRKYLRLNESDNEALECLNEIYEEALN